MGDRDLCHPQWDTGVMVCMYDDYRKDRVVRATGLCNMVCVADAASPDNNFLP